MARLLKECKSGKCCRFGDGDKAALLALLGECEGKCTGRCNSTSALLTQMGLPGRGGVTRGPGPAPLAMAQKTPETLGKFENKAFSGNVDVPDVPIGFTFTPPDQGSGEGASDAAGTAADFAAGGERITWHSRLLPRHSDVMKRYFSEPTR